MVPENTMPTRDELRGLVGMLRRDEMTALQAVCRTDVRTTEEAQALGARVGVLPTLKGLGLIESNHDLIGRANMTVSQILPTRLGRRVAFAARRMGDWK